MKYTHYLGFYKDGYKSAFPTFHDRTIRFGDDPNHFVDLIDYPAILLTDSNYLKLKTYP
jgi:hypothetical protein